MNNALTAAEILVGGAADYVVVPVDVPEWNGRVHVREFDGVSRDALEQWTVANRKTAPDGSFRTPAGFRQMVIALSACDKDGKLLFNAAADLDALSKKSAKALDRIYEAAARINGLGADEARKADFPAGQSSGSGIASPGISESAT